MYCTIIVVVNDTNTNTNHNTNDERINIVPSGYVNNIVFDITNDDIQQFESAKARRHYKKQKKKRNMFFDVNKTTSLK